MTDERPELGFAVLCDEQGAIQEVIHDHYGLSEYVKLGQSLIRLVDRDSVGKAVAFWETLQSQGATFDWELNVPVDGELRTLWWGGVRYDGRYLVLGGRTRNHVLQMYDDMMRMHNEQANVLRLTAKDNAELTSRMERDNALYEELSRLNNQLVNLQRELAKKNQQLQQLNDQKNQFLGMVSHDLRNPLSVIMMYSEFLLDDVAAQMSAEQRGFLSIIYSSSEFMLNMVNELLDIAKIESGKLTLDLAPTDLCDLVRQNVALNSALGARKQITIELACDEGLAPLLIDGAKIEQVLNNLLGNAVKFSYPGSRVLVSVRRMEGHVCVSVQDFGQGIPSDELSKLFKPFTRTSVKSTGGEKSTGLGLAIARRIVEGHEGRIWAESQVGEGTIFSFLLPLSGEAAAFEEKAEQPLVEVLSHLRVLLAEDSRVNQKVALRVLQRIGCEPDIVATGQEVLEALQAQPYDIVLMDMHMPEMDGLEATRQIRQRFSPDRQPTIIAMTASIQEADRQACRDAGMDGFVTKPIKLEALQEALQIRHTSQR